EIGRGGMGAVYLAERADGQFSKQVALKLVKRGMDTDEILRRFRTERQILAGLEHPHIARLYDGGVTEPGDVDPGGRPFLVMEYVDGRPVDAYCDAKRLSIDDRLALFQTVCEAVQYAHRNLVVHRDLKPSNILVSEDAAGKPQVKLLDFGIAKLLAEDGDLSVPMTKTGARVMTPEYAAPEQVQGTAITTATDVYALGIVLFELLTGRRPYGTTGRRLADIKQVVLDTEPERPSSAVRKPTDRVQRDGTTETITPEQISAVRASTADRLQRRLQGDLDVIVLKALRKEPERRYASAEALMEDIRRHRAGLPVSARPDTLDYRFRKFVKRHRFGVAAVAAFLILVLGVATMTAVQQAATARERDRAERERDRAEEVATFLKDLFNASDPYLATTDRLDTLRIREFLDLGATKVQREMKNEPVLQAEMLDVIGNVYRNLGLYDRAEPLLVEALEQRRALLGPAHRDVARSHQSLAETFQAKGEYESAERHFRQSLDLYPKQEEESSLLRAQALSGLASVLRDRNEFDEAELLLQEALTIQQAKLGDEHLDVAHSMLQLGRVYQDRGNLVDAESLYREVLRLHRKLLGDDHPKVAGSLDNLAVVLRQQTDLEAAEPLAREALMLRERTLGPDHPHTVTSVYEIAGLLRDKGNFEQAVALFKRIIEADRRTLGDRHHYVGLDWRELGTTYLRMGDYDEALNAYQASLDILHDALSENHADIAVVMSGVGNAHLQKGDLERAEPILRKVLDMRRSTLGEDSWWTGVSKSLLGDCLMRQQRYAEAEPLLVDGYETVRDGNGPTEATLRRLVTFYEAVGNDAEAEEYRMVIAGSP
ncbi:MAG TPA: serine/threonine-protein kinase, partial [Rhodothermales bacterium]|nr:serine/threonine-protein kinase [Rhodothermales bacterium]